MSYILDALKKSEQERTLGHVPGLGVEHAPPPVGRPRWLWILVAILLANGALVAMLLLRPVARDGGHDTQLAGNGPASPPAVVSSPAPPRPPAPAVQPAEPSPQQAVAPAASGSSPAVRAPAAGAVSAASVSPPSPTVTAEPAAPVAGSGSGQPSIPAPAVPPPAAETESPPPVPLQDLPAAFRAGLPALHMDVHVYADRPARRFVLINMHRYREGERLVEGPLLEKITPDGVILVYQGRRFLLPSQ